MRFNAQSHHTHFSSEADPLSLLSWLLLPVQYLRLVVDGRLQDVDDDKALLEFRLPHVEFPTQSRGSSPTWRRRLFLESRSAANAREQYAFAFPCPYFFPELPGAVLSSEVARELPPAPRPKQDRWLILHELGIIRPRNLAGWVARAMFQWHECCFTCANHACNGKRFVASRKDQKYCLLTEECAKYGHRAASRRHYHKKAKADGPQNMKESIPITKGTR